jgi:glutamine cyclotransferase
VINTATGKVEKEYDFSTLWPKAERSRQHADVFNGISISEDEDILYVTGKKWNRMYRIRLNVNE